MKYPQEDYKKMGGKIFRKPERLCIGELYNIAMQYKSGDCREEICSIKASDLSKMFDLTFHQAVKLSKWMEAKNL